MCRREDTYAYREEQKGNPDRRHRKSNMEMGENENIFFNRVLTHRTFERPVNFICCVFLLPSPTLRSHYFPL